MKLLRLVVIAVVVAVVSHIGVIISAPYVLMNVAMSRISVEVGTNAWRHAPRVTEKSRRIVRPSPDLAYSSCVYDLTNGPVRVTAAAWDDYMSVSVFASNSDNIFVINDRQATTGVEFVLVPSGTKRPSGSKIVVESPSTRGIVLQRRVAPTQERFDQAASARKGDVCQTIE
jgi:uncharacterized membrane protein